jgi:hypothetical protein
MSPYLAHKAQIQAPCRCARRRGERCVHRRRETMSRGRGSERLECLTDVHWDLVEPALVLALQPITVVATVAEAGLRATAVAPGAGTKSGRGGMRGPKLAALDADLIDAGDLG